MNRLDMASPPGGKWRPVEVCVYQTPDPSGDSEDGMSRSGF
jgi:hypothetical protein